MKLLLFPNVLFDEGDHRQVIPESVDRAVAGIDCLIAESEKGGRRFLKRFVFPVGKSFRDIPIHLLNEHSSPQDIAHLAAQITSKDQTWGLVSDAGLPCLADPGARLVFLCRQKGVEIEAFSGPSSMVMALELSGLTAQAFAFHGYLPQEGELLKKKLVGLEERARKEKATQLWIETPYRNEKMLKVVCEVLQGPTLLCVASGLTSPEQRVVTQPISAWRKESHAEWDDKPAVFLIL